jgi:hypothetical protein
MSVLKINPQENNKKLPFKVQEDFPKIKSKEWSNKPNNLNSKIPREDKWLI